MHDHSSLLGGPPPPPADVALLPIAADGESYARDRAWLPTGWESSSRPRRDDLESTLAWLGYAGRFCRWSAEHPGAGDPGEPIRDAHRLLARAKHKHRWRGDPAEPTGPFSDTAAGWAAALQAVEAARAWLDERVSQKQVKRRWTVGQADEAARELLPVWRRAGRRITARSLADKIGCSKALVLKTPAWRAYRLGLAESPGEPRAVALGEARLRQLVAEQAEDAAADSRQHRRRPRV